MYLLLLNARVATRGSGSDALIMRRGLFLCFSGVLACRLCVHFGALLTRHLMDKVLGAFLMSATRVFTLGAGVAAPKFRTLPATSHLT